MTGGAGMGGLKKSVTIKMSDNEEVRKELIEQSTPNALTSFFYRRPCISIWTPYIILLLMTVIVQLTDYFKMALQDDSWLVNDDDKVRHRDMVKLAKWELNRKAAGIDSKQEKLEENQVRFESGGMEQILVIYEDKSGRATGIFDKDTVVKIIELENKLTSWDKKSDNFTNKKFNGSNVAWKNMCFAGLDAPHDPRTNTSKCLKNQAYISLSTMFKDDWALLMQMRQPA